MRSSCAYITFITGAGFHTAISKEFSASGWEWKAAKEAIEDGYERKVREHITQNIGHLGNFSIKRYFSEARDRVFDAKFVSNGMDIVSLSEHRRTIARDIKSIMENNRCLYRFPNIKVEYKGEMRILSKKVLCWFMDVVLWFSCVIEECETNFLLEKIMSRAKEISKCFLENSDADNIFSETVNAVQEVIVFVLQNTSPKDGVNDIPIVRGYTGKERKVLLEKRIYVLLVDLIVAFYSLLGLINVLGVDKRIRANAEIRRIMTKLPININLKVNINTVISNILDKRLSEILFDSKILEVLSTGYPFLEIRERLSEWYASFFVGDITGAKKYVYVSKILMHYLRKQFKQKVEKGDIDEGIENSKLKSFIDFMRTYADAIVTTNYVPIESKILFDDFRKWAEDGRGRCDKRVIYTHGHLEEEIVVAMYMHNRRKGKMVDFRFEAFHSPLEGEEVQIDDLRSYIEKEVEGWSSEGDIKQEEYRINLRVGKINSHGMKEIPISLFTIPAAVPPLAYKTFANGFFARRYQIAVETLLNSRRIVVIGFGLNPEDHFFQDVLDLYLYYAYKNLKDKRIIYVKYTEGAPSQDDLNDTVFSFRQRFPMFFTECGLGTKISFEANNNVIDIPQERPMLRIIFGKLNEVVGQIAEFL